MYNYFFRFQLISFTIVPSLYFFYTISRHDHYYFILYVLNNLFEQVLPLWLSATIQSQLDKIQWSLYNFYYENTSHLAQTTLKKWILVSIHTAATFDCGYFTVDVPLLSFVFDFITLFVFAIIQ